MEAGPAWILVLGLFLVEMASCNRNIIMNVIFSQLSKTLCGHFMRNEAIEAVQNDLDYKIIILYNSYYICNSENTIRFIQWQNWKVGPYVLTEDLLSYFPDCSLCVSSSFCNKTKCRSTNQTVAVFTSYTTEQIFSFSIGSRRTHRYSMYIISRAHSHTDMHTQRVK